MIRPLLALLVLISGCPRSPDDAANEGDAGPFAADSGPQFLDAGGPPDADDGGTLGDGGSLLVLLGDELSLGVEDRDGGQIATSPLGGVTTDTETSDGRIVVFSTLNVDSSQLGRFMVLRRSGELISRWEIKEAEIPPLPPRPTESVVVASLSAERVAVTRFTAFEVGYLQSVGEVRGRMNLQTTTGGWLLTGSFQGPTLEAKGPTFVRSCQNDFWATGPIPTAAFLAKVDANGEPDWLWCASSRGWIASPSFVTSGERIILALGAATDVALPTETGEVVLPGPSSDGLLSVPLRFVVVSIDFDSGLAGTYSTVVDAVSVLIQDRLESGGISLIVWPWEVSFVELSGADAGVDVGGEIGTRLAVIDLDDALRIVGARVAVESTAPIDGRITPSPAALVITLAGPTDFLGPDGVPIPEDPAGLTPVLLLDGDAHPISGLGVGPAANAAQAFRATKWGRLGYSGRMGEVDVVSWPNSDGAPLSIPGTDSRWFVALPTGADTSARVDGCEFPASGAGHSVLSHGDGSLTIESIGTGGAPLPPCTPEDGRPLVWRRYRLVDQ